MTKPNDVALGVYRLVDALQAQDKIDQLRRGAISRGWSPDAIRSAVDLATVGLGDAIAEMLTAGQLQPRGQA